MRPTKLIVLALIVIIVSLLVFINVTPGHFQYKLPVCCECSTLRYMTDKAQTRSFCLMLCDPTGCKKSPVVRVLEFVTIKINYLDFNK